jgi:predicted permease
MRRFVLRLIAFLRATSADAELDRELTSHVRLLEDSLVANGMSAGDAAAAARRAFGGQFEQVRLRQRDARSFRWLDESWLDLKLGVRLALKYPGLTVIAVSALAVAIGSGAAYLEFVHDLLRAEPPGPDGRRIVAIQYWDAAAGAAEDRLLHDFARWRVGLRSFDELGAYARTRRNVITDDGRAEPVLGVAISASAFRIMRDAPLLGRPLVEEDERPGAPAVAVIGEDLWRARFHADADIIGQRIRIGADAHTIVGVMPASFGFPINQRLWVPLHADDGPVPRFEGAAIRVFGRLAPGVKAETAHAELLAVAQQLDGESPAPSRQLRPVVRPYVQSMIGMSGEDRAQVVVLYAANLVFMALLAVCAVNLATLVFARTAMRESEITVRTALGASRGRIVLQLFAEALILAVGAAGVGLIGAAYVTGWGTEMFRAGAMNNAPLPFWWDTSLSYEAWSYAGLLAVLAALMVGVVPALKATGQQMQARLKHAAAATTLRLGGVWTTVIVAQIALTVIALMSIVSLGWNLYLGGYRNAETVFPRERYLTATVDRDGGLASTSQDSTRTRAELNVSYGRLAERLLAEPGVRAVSYANGYAGTARAEFILEFESIPTPQPANGPLWVKTMAIGHGFFASLNVPIVQGRGFSTADVESERPVALVDETFVRLVLGGMNPIGQRVRRPRDRESPTAGPWYEIIGVVPDLARLHRKTTENAVLYTPASPAGAQPLRLVLAVDADPRAFETRLLVIAAEVDPLLRLDEVMRLDQTDEADRIVFDFLLKALIAVSAVTLLLATAGVYALLSFTVARRTREIGIRAAIGADRRRILTGLFSRAFAQVGLGILAGSVPGVLLVALGAPEVASGSGAAMGIGSGLAIAAFMLTVTALACIVPARRALSVDPTDCLRADS